MAQRTHAAETHRYRVPDARGGVAFGPILTGVVVAFGAMFLLSALIGVALAGYGYFEGIPAGEAVTLGIGVGIALVVAQFLSYMWGGYTAGRMGRGAGIANGILVPVTAIVLALIVAGIGVALGTQMNVNLPFTQTQLPLENQTIVNWGTGIGIASLVAMFLGGALGGVMGARWHTKLETRVTESDTVATETAAPAEAGAGSERPTSPPRVTGEGVRYEADGTTTRRVDDGPDAAADQHQRIDLTEERSEGHSDRR